MGRILGRIGLLAALSAMLLTACGTPDSLKYSGSKLRITSSVFGSYQNYLGKQGGVRKDGVFLVVMNNDVGVGSRWSYCPPTADYCTTGGLNVANDMCVEEHLKCVLFARGPKIVLPYEIID